jgi:hypothetical protein
LIHDEKEILRETYIRKPIRIFKKVIEANPIQLVFQYFQLRSSLKKIQSNQVVFFFPFCHVGGAEKVHASIVSVAKEKSPTVFFTKKSDNTDYLNAFEENATCYDIWKLCWYPFFRDIAKAFSGDAVNPPVIFNSKGIMMNDSAQFTNWLVFARETNSNLTSEEFVL